MGIYCYVAVLLFMRGRLGGASVPTEGGEGQGHIVVARGRPPTACWF